MVLADGFYLMKNKEENCYTLAEIENDNVETIGNEMTYSISYCIKRGWEFKRLSKRYQPYYDKNK